MAALDFPASPSNGQTYTGPGGVVWTWDGSKWVTQGIATAYLPLAGGTMTGPLQLIPGSVTAAALRFDVTTNTGLYGAAGSVGIATSGVARLTVNDTSVLSTVPITLPGAPTLPLNAATKGYVDGFLPLTGGTLTGSSTIAPASGEAALMVNKSASGLSSVVYGQKGGAHRWGIWLGDGSAESGGNAGSAFLIGRMNDAGAILDFPVSISRATGNTSLSGAMTISGALSVGPNGVFRSGSGTTFIQSSGVDVIVMEVGATSFRQAEHQFANANFTAFQAIFNASGTANNSGAWTTISDAGVKENVQPYTRGLADLIQLQPVSFSYVAGTPFADPASLPRIGLIAQEVEPYVPEIVKESEITRDGQPVTVLTLEPSNLIYAVINSIKELATRVEQLEGTPTP